MVRTRYGRLLRIDEDTKDGSILNFAIQGNASDIFKKALLSIDTGLNEVDAKIIHTLYDSILIEVHKSQVSDVSTLVQICMNDAFKEIIPEVPSQVEIKTGTDWGDMAILNDAGSTVELNASYLAMT